MQSLDEQEEKLDKLTNLWAEEVIKKVDEVNKEMDEFYNFLDLWKNEIENAGFKIDKIETKLKGKKEWDGEQY